MDWEKVVRDLRYLKSFGRVINNLQITEIAENAIALLKEQQQKTARLGDRLREAGKLIKDQERKINDQRASMKELMLKFRKCKDYLSTENGSANMNRRD